MVAITDWIGRMRLFSSFRKADKTKRQRKDAAQRLYGTISARARDPYFYQFLGVPDTVDGRFEMVALHVFLVFERLRDAGNAEASLLAQEIYDTLFADMDVALREMGAGDLGVGKRIRFMTEALKGRIEAYGEGIAALSPGVSKPETSALEGALRRNLYGTLPEIADGLVRQLASYVARAHLALKTDGLDRLMAGEITFPPLTGL